VIDAVHQIVTRWHHNKTLTIILTLTLKITVIYAVKDGTFINKSYFPRDGWVYKRPITPQRGDH